MAFVAIPDKVKQISSKLEISPTIVRDVIDSYIKLSKDALISGERFYHRDFVSFKVAYKQIRKPPHLMHTTEPLMGYRLVYKLTDQFIKELKTGKCDTGIIRSAEYGKVKTKKVVIRSVASKEEEVIRLKEKNTMLLNRISSLKRTITSKNEQLKKKKSQDSYKLFKKKKVAWGKAQANVNKRAVEFVYDRMKLDRIKNSYFLDAISVFPFIQEYQKEKNYDAKLLNLFILINHFRQFQVKDSIAFGFTDKSCRTTLDKLLKRGLIEKFGTYIKYFVPSISGAKEFSELQKLCNRRLKVLFREYDKKIEGREGNTYVKYRGKFLHEIDILKDDEPTEK